MLVVLAHEEPHPVAVPENVALDKLTVVTAVAHRSVDPLWHMPHAPPAMHIWPLCYSVTFLTTFFDVTNCWKYALEPTGFDPLVDSDGFDPLWCKSPNGPQML
jgi:hypothetical protein